MLFNWSTDCDFQGWWSMDAEYLKCLLGLPHDMTDDEVKKEWKRRSQHVCKPCWELKYCPYGVLVEQFPVGSLDGNADFGPEQVCSIFGHVCPVYIVNEPFTESRGKRRISRGISPRTMIRVARRDNYICQSCGLGPLREEDIEFDHIIPFSLGGCSDEKNVQVLCIECNRAKNADVLEVVSDHAYVKLRDWMVASVKEKAEKRKK